MIHLKDSLEALLWALFWAIVVALAWPRIERIVFGTSGRTPFLLTRRFLQRFRWIRVVISVVVVGWSVTALIGAIILLTISDAIPAEAWIEGWTFRLLTNTNLYIGLPLAVVVLGVGATRAYRNRHDNETICDVFRNNALIATLLHSGRSKTDGDIDQYFRDNLSAAMSFSRNHLLPLFVGPFVWPVRCALLFLPGDGRFEMKYVRCSVPKYQTALDGLVKPEHFPPRIDKSQLVALVERAYDELEKANSKSEKRSAFHQAFDNHKSKCLSLVGRTWEEQSLQFEDFPPDTLDVSYLKDVPKKLKSALTLRSVVCIPVKNNGRMLAVVLVGANRYCGFRDATRQFYEKYSHALGETVALMQMPEAVHVEPYRRQKDLNQSRKFFEDLEKVLAWPERMRSIFPKVPAQ